MLPLLGIAIGTGAVIALGALAEDTFQAEQARRGLRLDHHERGGAPIPHCEVWPI